MTCELIYLIIVFMAQSGVDLPRKIPPVLVETKERLRVTAEEKAHGATSFQMTAEEAARFKEFSARLDQLFAIKQAVPTLQTVSRFEDELYADMGLPHLNGRWQLMVVHEIAQCAQHPQAGVEIVDGFRSILLDYSRAGGGCGSPLEMVRLAEALSLLGGPANPECDSLAMELCDKAERFAKELESDVYNALTERRIADVRRILAWQPLSDASPGMVKASARELRDLSAYEPCIRILAMGESVAPFHVQRACNILQRFKGAIQADAVTRLLMAIQTVLDEKQKRRVSKEVIRCIDEKLLWLAGESKMLVTGAHWSLWADNVAELGPHRASKELKRFVHDAKKRPHSEMSTHAIARAAMSLKRD